MDVEAVINSLVGPLVGNRLYWDTTPQSGPPKDVNGDYLPFAVAQIVGGADQEYVNQDLPDHENVRLQIVAFSLSSLTSSNLIRTIRSTILGAYKPASIIGSPISVPDPRLMLRGRLQHFSLWVKP